MRKFLIAAAATAALLPALGVAPAGAAEVTNGGFETDDFTGWTIDQLPPGGGGVWQTYDEGDIEGPPPPPCGTFAALLTQGEPSSDVLYQDLELEADATHELTFQHSYNNEWDGQINPTSAVDRVDGPPSDFLTPDTLSIDEPNQQYRIDIVDPDADPFSVASGDVLEPVFRTEDGDPANIDYTEVTVDLSAYAGQTVRLRFAAAITEDELNVGVDCVELASTPNPTTTTTSTTTTTVATTTTAAAAPAVAARPAFTG